MINLKSLTGIAFAVVPTVVMTMMLATAACAPKVHDVTPLDKSALAEVSTCDVTTKGSSPTTTVSAPLTSDLGVYDCGYFKVKLYTCAPAAAVAAVSTATSSTPQTQPSPAPELSSFNVDQTVAAEFIHYVKNSPAGMNPIHYHGYALIKKVNAKLFSGKLSLNAYDRDDKFARNLKGGAFTMASSDFKSGFRLTATEPRMVFGKGGTPVWKTLVWKTDPATYETNCVKTGTNAD